MSRVLIMDDNIIIRKAAGRVLSRMGHAVQYASNGEGAIALYKKAHESQGPFDVVILDLAIQDGMGGKEAIAQLLSIDTHVKAIVSSGYVNDPMVVEYEKYGFRGVITKPYSMKDLAAALHKVLDET